MAHIEKHKPGAFCWIELATTDQPGAHSFYSALFGWSVKEMPMGPDGAYDFYELEGRVAAAGYKLRPDDAARGVPPHWMPYVAVESADDSAAMATRRGATILMAPLDVFEAGRMAIIRDPTSAAFAIWQPKLNQGIGISGVPGTLCWADLATRDVPAAKAFYEGLFGWKISASPNDASGYLHIQNGESEADMIGGIPTSKHLNPHSPPHWVSYFFVADCNASAAKAKELGATLHMGPQFVQNVGTMAFVGDPQGAIFALFTSARRS